MGARGRGGDRRDAILDQALLLVGQRGYRGLSYQDVADRCGLTKQGIMHYFPTKKQLLLSLLQERDALLEGDMLGALEASGFAAATRLDEMRARFRASLFDVIEKMLEAPEFVRFLVVLRAEAIDPEHPAHPYFAQRDRGTLAWLAEHGRGLTARPESTARLVLATMSGLQEQWLREEQGFDILAEWDRALTLLLPD